MGRTPGTALWGRGPGTGRQWPRYLPDSVLGLTVNPGWGPRTTLYWLALEGFAEPGGVSPVGAVGLDGVVADGHRGRRDDCGPRDGGADVHLVGRDPFLQTGAGSPVGLSTRCRGTERQDITSKHRGNFRARTRAPYDFQCSSSSGSVGRSRKSSNVLSASRLSKPLFARKSAYFLYLDPSASLSTFLTIICSYFTM